MLKTKRKRIAISPQLFFLHPGARFFITRNPFSLLFEYRSFLREGEWAEGELGSVSSAIIKRGKNAEYQLSVGYRYTDPFSQQGGQAGQKASRNDLRR